MMSDVGKLFLRLGIGGLMIFHGIAKIGPGFDLETKVSGIKGALEANGLPAALTYGVFGGEILAPALVVLGLWTRMSAFVIAATMAMAVFLMHSGDFGSLSKGGAWALELQALYFLGALSITCLGPGRIAIQKETSS